MDIISEILETDRLAEETLEKARAQRAKLIEECDGQVAEIAAAAEREAEEYRRAAQAEIDAAAGDTAAADAGARALRESYDRLHEKWERDILEAVLKG